MIPRNRTVMVVRQVVQDRRIGQANHIAPGQGVFDLDSFRSNLEAAAGRPDDSGG